MICSSKEATAQASKPLRLELALGGEPRILPRRLSVEVADPHSRARPLLASALAAE